MNKSLKFELAGIIILLIAAFDLLRFIPGGYFAWSDRLYIIYYSCVAVAVALGITAFVCSIKEIKRNENKAQAVTALVLSSITGILLPIGIIALFALLLSSGGH